MGRERALQAHQDQMLRFLGIHHYFSAPVQHLTISFSRSSRRRGSGGVEGAPSRGEESAHERQSDLPPRMSSGATAGLHSRESLKVDMDRMRHERQEKFNSVNPATLGRGADTVVRDKTGRRKAAAVAVLEGNNSDEENMEWGKGYVDPKRKALEDAAADIGGVARYVDDAVLNKRQRAVDRWGDPMLQFQKSRPRAKGVKKWKKDYPSNRFNLSPGYRWDGVDRSNGYEKKWYLQKNEAHDLAHQAHMWSTEDM
uniref:BUD13 homolog n=1 Tax=Palpitomonas bilix TaxID=652834 RepID=A0A7S3G428_9EUKA|mmetsp:Transcript_23861/g.60338  ORF Transcript_23861/g.60338 Transcript_23861/m.60338 type:complete len:255 (+) Transcript_23861:466-1230(+)